MTLKNWSGLFIGFLVKKLLPLVGNPISESIVSFELHFTLPDAPGGHSGFQVTGMIEWGQKSDPKKSLHQNLTPQKSTPNFRAIKICRGTTRPGYAGTITNLHTVLNTPKNPLLKSSYPKKYSPKFSYPKKSRNRTFQTPKKSFDHPCHLKSWVPPVPTPPGLMRKRVEKSQAILALFDGFQDLHLNW